MGITIHYTYEFYGEKPQLENILQQVREQFQQMELIRLGEIFDISDIGPRHGHTELDDLSFSLWHSMRMYHEFHEFTEESQQILNEIIHKEGNGIGFQVTVSKDCDPFRVILGRMNDNAVWHGTDFIKTQYAEHVEKAHETVIEMLRICKHAGILRSVCDEAGYWQDPEDS